MAGRALARPVAGAVAATLIGATLFSAASADEAHGDPTIAGTPVDVGQAACGTGWSGGPAGRLSFAIWNSASVVEEVQVESLDAKKIFLDVEDLGVGATRAVTLALPAGKYRFVCLAADGAPYAGPAWQLTGSFDGATTPGVLPTSERDFVGPVDAYTSWVSGQLTALRGEVATLTTDLEQGRLRRARAAWKRAHRQYLLLGAAYDAFGEAGERIDPTLTPGVAPLSDPGLTGFPKIEAVLWNVQPVAAVKRSGLTRKQFRVAHRAAKKARKRLTAALRGKALPVARQLGADVGTVAATFGAPVQPTNTDMGLRAHEILEDALRFGLTGRTDAGAHLTLLDIDTMVDATRDIIAPLRGLLAKRDPDLAATDAWLARLQTYVDTFHDPRTDTWTPYQSLSVAQRRRLEATLSQTLEYLSEIAVDIDPVQAGPSS